MLSGCGSVGSVGISPFSGAGGTGLLSLVHPRKSNREAANIEYNFACIIYIGINYTKILIIPTSSVETMLIKEN
jgi:hypothetical protein